MGTSTPIAACLAKPIKAALLYETLVSAVRGEPASSPAAPSPVPGPTRVLDVLPFGQRGSLRQQRELRRLEIEAQLSSEVRKVDSSIALAHKHAEEGRVAVRNVRRDANEHLKKLLKEHETSEDDEKHALAEVQRLTDQHIEEINVALKNKEAEIMEV